MDAPTETEISSNSCQSDVLVSAQAEVETTQLEVQGGSKEVWFHLKVTHAGKEYPVQVAGSDRVFDLKDALAKLTRVPPERQKILGLNKGKLPTDEARLDIMNLTDGRKFTLVGTPQGDEFKDPSDLRDIPDVVNDLDIDFFNNPEAARAALNDVRNHRKIREVTQKLQIYLMNPLRPGMRLLVLDIDYTILDTKPLTNQSLPPTECARPHLDEFLTKIYPYYDICIWSQTSWVWIETKLAELGLIGAEQPYNFAFVLDKTSMFTVFSNRNNQIQKHHVKPLKIIWNHLPQFNAKNTIHIDDLGRNFALNPGEGLKISPFKNAHSPAAAEDRELLRLADYLVRISSVSDFQTLDHRKWRKSQE